MIVTHQPLNLSYFIPDIAGALALYDHLRWWRSRDGVLYEQATAATAAGATLLGRTTSPFALNGKTFSFIVNGVTQVDVTFADPDPVTISQVITDITTATGLVTATNVGGALQLQTVATGSGSSIEIVPSDAAPYLGFDSGQAAVGLDADTALVTNVHEYFEMDQNSDTSFSYRVEVRNNTTLQTAGLGAPFQPEPPGVPDANRIWAFIRLLDLTGRPIQGRIVTLANVAMPNSVVVSPSIFGVFRHYAQMSTNAQGYAQVRILRGMSLDINVDGSDFTRRLLIPTTGDAVDLLDPTLVVEDEFGIQQPDIDFAVRTT